VRSGQAQELGPHVTRRADDADGNHWDRLRAFA
jgi:hypothetical protein